MDTAGELHLRSGPPRRPGAILLSFIGIFFLTAAGLRLYRKQRLLEHLDGLLVSAVMLLILAAVLLRNLVFRESLCIVREPGGKPVKPMATLFCHDIVAVEQAESPAYGTPAWGWYCLGFSRGPVVLTTRQNGTLFFGSGMAPDRAAQLVARVRNFCGGTHSADTWPHLIPAGARVAAAPDSPSYCVTRK